MSFSREAVVYCGADVPTSDLVAAATADILNGKGGNDILVYDAEDVSTVSWKGHRLHGWRCRRLRASH